jgi:ATP-binding cassette subfamily F protein 3
MLVSHDRALLREVCDEFWLVTAGGVSPFDGDLDDYQRWLLEVSRAIARGAEPPPPPKPALADTAPPPPPPPAPKDEPRRAAGKAGRDARAALQAQTRPLRVEIQQIDARLERLGREKAEVEAALSDPAASDYAELGRRLAHVGAEIAMLEERWLDLQTQLEAMTA